MSKTNIELETVDLITGLVKDKAEVTSPSLPDLRLRINDVIPFADGPKLRIHVLASQGNSIDQATDAYYGLLAAISNI